MQFIDAIYYAIKNLSTRGLRSWLTVFGIIIGVTTIISIMSIGEGLKKDITSQLESFGSDSMFIIPVNIEKSKMSLGSMGGGTTSGKLFEKDVEKINGIAGIKSVSKLAYGRASLEFKEKKISSLVYAATSEMFGQWSNMYVLEEGRFFKDSEEEVAVLGNDAANELFGKDQLRVGNFLTINGKKYRVVGILKKIGSSLSQNDDQSIFVPFGQGKELFGTQLSKNEISFISVKIEEGADAEQVKEKIDSALASLHRVTLEEKDFTVVTADFVNKTIGAILDMVTAFLFMITLISAVVGGIGIANTMFTSVIERTKEIGIMKAVGASRWDITLIFLVESMVIGLVGGLIGIASGVLILYVISTFGVPVLIRVELVVFALMFSLLVGLVSGMFPARQAAALDPVEALGFE